jgi:hypothetical protein
MRNRTLMLSGLIVILALLLLSCTMGSGGVSNVTATPTKTPRPLFTSTHTPTAMPLPTDTPLPTTVPTEIPPTDTVAPPTEPPPTATPLPPTEAPPTEVPATETAIPPTEAPPTNTPQPKPTNTPPPPTNTPKPQVDFRVKEIVAFEDGSLTSTGLHNIYFTVVDAGGAPIDGIILKDANNQPGEEVTTGNKGPGRTEFTMWAADYRFKVIGNVSGKAFTSETTHVLSVLHGHAVWDDLIRGGICSDPAACEAMGSIHYSYNVTFQRTW